MKLITTTDDLAAFCKPLAHAEFVAVDTEFMRERTYWPKLCLAQVAGPDDAAAIDALAEGIDLAPLDELMANPEGAQGLPRRPPGPRNLLPAHEQGAAPLFDTQVAAMVCGHGEAASYESLATKLAKADRQVEPLHRLEPPAAQRAADHLCAVRRHPSARRLREASPPAREERPPAVDRRGDGGAERSRRPTAPIPNRPGAG